MGAEARLRELQGGLPAPWPVFRSAKMARQIGSTVITSAHAPSLVGEPPLCLGAIGADIDVDEAARAARACALCCLSSIKQLIGSLDKVRRVSKVSGFLRVAPGFHGHGRVLNSFSDVLVEIFGEESKHVRTIVGAPTLIGNQAMEIELWVEVAE